MDVDLCIKGFVCVYMCLLCILTIDKLQPELINRIALSHTHKSEFWLKQAVFKVNMLCVHVYKVYQCLCACVCFSPELTKIGNLFFSITRPAYYWRGEERPTQRSFSQTKQLWVFSRGETKEGGKEGREKYEETINKGRKRKWKSGRARERERPSDRKLKRECSVTLCQCACWEGWVSRKRNNENADSLHCFHSNLLFCCSYFLQPCFFCWLKFSFTLQLKGSLFESHISAGVCWDVVNQNFYFI